MTASRQQVAVTITTNPQSAQPLQGGNYFPPARVGTPWAGSLWGVGGTAGYGYAVISKPAWMTAATVTILGVAYLTLTGTPGASGAVTVDITDGTPTTQRVTFYLNVTAAIAGIGGVPQIQPAYSGQPYRLDLTTLLTNATLPLASVTLTSGTLPTGITIASPLLTATNVTGSSQNVVLTITDGAANVAVLALPIVVKPGLSVSTFAPPAILGQAYSGKVTVTGGSGKYSIIQVPANPLPAGIVIAPSTGIISGQPTTMTPTSGATATHFQITDLVTGEVKTTTLLSGTSKIIPITQVAPPAPLGMFVTTDSDGSQRNVDYLQAFFGGGSDGNLTIDGSTSYAFATLSGGVNSASRDIYANNVTFTGSGHLNMNGRRLFVAGILDISAASANAIATSATVSGPGRLGIAGGVKGTGTATNGNAGSAVTPTPFYIAGGNSQQGGVGGHGVSTNTGGNPGGIPSPNTIRPLIFYDQMLGLDTSFGVALAYAGVGGSGGGGGGGSGSLPGGDGSDGGYGGDYIFIAARTINRGASTAAGAINASGGASAAGASASGLGNKGGGAAGGAGSGGCVRIYYGNLTGALAGACIKANGGNAGNGGNITGVSPATVGQGGDGGNPGVIILADLLQGITSMALGSSPTTHSGQTGGTGGTNQVTL